MTAIFIISSLLFLGYAALLIFYRLGWSAAPVFSASENQKPSTRISLIIPARNEEKYIKACLDSITRQSYPIDLFEVLVVDDHSTDATASIINSYAGSNIRCIRLQDLVEAGLNSYKKKAIELAVGQSTGTLIVTTDADCILPPQWLSSIAAFYEKHKPAFIAAPVAILPSPGGEGPGLRSFIEIFQSLDFMTLQGITGAAVHKKMHNMCNGANLAYEKAAFNAVSGFAGIDSIASGDDMLLMHKIYKQYPDRVLFLKSPAAIVQTAPVTTIAQFFNQRIRWASKADQYQDKSMLPVLLLVYLFNVSLLLVPILSIFFPQQLSILNSQFSILNCWLLLLLLKTIIELIFLYPVAGFFKNTKLLLWFPVMQPFHIIYTIIAGFLGKFGSYHWKGRSVK